MKMRLILWGCALFFLLPSTLLAQDKRDPRVQAETQQAVLLEMASRHGELARQKKEYAWNLAKEKGWETRIIDTLTGQIRELIEIGPAGDPIYYGSTNQFAAITISTNKVYTGGGLGLSLSGAAIPLRLWDGGCVRATHQELTGRVTRVDDNTSAPLQHSTHVAGTMIASGAVASRSKGMSFAGTLRSFDWNYDGTEMASEAAAGALLSNHSYGIIGGWNTGSSLNGTSTYWYGWEPLSRLEDYKFGFYSNYAQLWDSIAYLAPFYLICKSAGNDRTDTFPPGTSHNVQDSLTGNWRASTLARNRDGNSTGYDCITASGLSKNVLTVGSVGALASGYTNAASVALSSFSSTGPTDDGRIKPDIVAQGESLYSTSSSANNVYATLSGTSMATPSVTGSLNLLQQHFFNRYARYMRASTLKALAIHTADECGPNPGPDYRFGWGLMNTAKAATLITQNGNNDHILEDSLQNGQTWEIELYSDGSTFARATLCWNDIPASIVAWPNWLNNRSPRLVNDLDVRILASSNGNTTYLPYVLDYAQPANAATTGDNVRDNVEQIHLSTLPAGWYTLRITHKGTLYSNLKQKFSLILSGFSRMNVFASTGNWSNASAWSLGAKPASSGSILIKSGTLTVSDSGSVKHVFMKTGARLMVPASSKLDIYGDLNIADSLFADGVLSFKGSQTQKITAYARIGQLILASSDTLKMQNATVEITDRLNAQTGKISSNGNLIFRDGAIILDASTVNPGGSVIGNIQYKKTGASHYRVYNYWSSPVVGATFSTTFQGAASSDLYRYNASTQAWVNASGSLQTGWGYTVPGHVNSTRLFRGVPQNGTISVAVVNNPGATTDWNLIGNPYPSPLNASAFVSANASVINGTLYFWDRTAPYFSGSFISDYASWNLASQTAGTGGRVPNGRISPAQGFLVDASASGNVQFTNSMRISGSTVLFRESRNAVTYWLSLRNKEGNFSQISVVLRSDATPGWDPLYDARRLSSSHDFCLYTGTAEEPMAIQSLPIDKDNPAVPLGIENTLSAQVYLQLDSVEGDFNAWPLYLIDNELLSAIPLIPGKEYTVKPVLARYSLQWKAREWASQVEEALILADRSSLRIRLPEKESIKNVELWNMTGKRIWDLNLQEASSSLDIPMAVPAAAYLVRLTTGQGQTIVRKIVYLP